MKRFRSPSLLSPSLLSPSLLSPLQEECFNIVDIKPPSMEDLTEVITSCQFHPSHCHMMIHSSSKGSIKLGDLRARALVDTQSKVLQQSVEVGSDKSFFSEIIASISDARFSPDGRYIVSRDYMTLKLWDVNMESSPVLTIPLQQHLTSKFVQLYENDCIFDKFECCVSGDGMFVGSGSYDGVFKVFNASTGKMESEVRMGTEHMERSQTATDFNFSEKVSEGYRSVCVGGVGLSASRWSCLLLLQLS